MDTSFVLPGVGLAAHPAARDRWRSFRASDELVAPTLLWAECASVLKRQAHREVLTDALARRLLEAMLRLPIRPVHYPPHYLRAFDIAASLGLRRAYDSLYLAVAETERAEILTIDSGMHDAARRLSLASTLLT